jgi:hypothetical protein
MAFLNLRNDDVPDTVRENADYSRADIVEKRPDIIFEAFR